MNTIIHALVDFYRGGVVGIDVAFSFADDNDTAMEGVLQVSDLERQVFAPRVDGRAWRAQGIEGGWARAWQPQGIEGGWASMASARDRHYDRRGTLDAGIVVAGLAPAMLSANI
jgi:hypothetical protein